MLVELATDVIGTMSSQFAVVLMAGIVSGTFLIWFLIHRKYTLHGKIIVDVNEMSGRINYSLEIDIDPYEIQNMKHVSFEVVKVDHDYDEDATEIAN